MAASGPSRGHARLRVGEYINRASLLSEARSGPSWPPRQTLTRECRRGKGLVASSRYSASAGGSLLDGRVASQPERPPAGLGSCYEFEFLARGLLLRGVLRGSVLALRRRLTQATSASVVFAFSSVGQLSLTTKPACAPSRNQQAFFCFVYHPDLRSDEITR